MGLLLRFAWRNTWRNSRRSILTILAVVFATWLAVAMRGMQVGTYRTNIENAVRMFSSYVQIQRPGYQKNPVLQVSFAYDDPLRRTLQHPNISGAAPRIYADGLASFRENSKGVFLIGIDHRSEMEVTILSQRLLDGRFGAPGSHEVVMGHKLLANLKASVGDRIVILAQGADGSMGNLFFTVSGTLRTGSAELDDAAIVMDLMDSQELLGMEGRVHALALALTSLEEIEPVRKDLSDGLGKLGLVSLSWKEIMPELDQMIEMDDVSGILFLAILVVIVAFGILNTVLMSVSERLREFGVLISMGLPPPRLVAIVLLEVCFLTLIGMTAGNLLGAGVNYYLVRNPIIFGGEFGQIYEEFGFLPQLNSTMDPRVFINTSVYILLAAVASAIYPVVKLYRLEPLKGLRHT